MKISKNFRDFKNLISSAPVLPKSAKTVIADASLIAKGEREKAEKEMKLAVSEVFTKYNKEYGLNLNINLDNLSESLTLVADPDNRKVLELLQDLGFVCVGKFKNEFGNNIDCLNYELML